MHHTRLLHFWFEFALRCFEASSEKGKSKKRSNNGRSFRSKEISSQTDGTNQSKRRIQILLSQRRRQIEAINGAWAMIGLTVGLVIEGQTGKSILAQLAGYWDAIVGFIVR
ncbi:uncharacterized protein LOC121747181 isoform X1 [Salvia splendens]|uniref:uncharacterized protein LOC121747181 isoform X1 n=1 Tax=Salvia splendens TaxID=180675 RepID=UPI001C262F0E|nr:uncharacterized protein LOC121747181 isoform X1 [Salvia splendens]